MDQIIEVPYPNYRDQSLNQLGLWASSIRQFTVLHSNSKRD